MIDNGRQAIRFLQRIEKAAAEADDVLTKSLPIATKLAYWVMTKTNSRIPLEDLQQTALLALMEVFHSGKPDPNEDDFNKYLTTVIVQRLHAAIRENNPIYLRSQVRYDALKYKEYVAAGLTDEDIMEKYNWRSDKIRNVKRACAAIEPMTSLDLPLADDDSLTVGNTIPDEAPGPEAVVLDLIEVQEVQNEIRDAINTLPIRQAQALSFTFCVPADITERCSVADVMTAFESQSNDRRGRIRLREVYGADAKGTPGISADGFYSPEKVTGEKATSLLEKEWRHYRAALLRDERIPD